MGKEQPYIKKIEKVWVNEYTTGIIKQRAKIYSLLSTIYLPTIYPLLN